MHRRVAKFFSPLPVSISLEISYGSSVHAHFQKLLMFTNRNCSSGIPTAVSPFLFPFRFDSFRKESPNRLSKSRIHLQFNELTQKSRSCDSWLFTFQQIWNCSTYHLLLSPSHTFEVNKQIKWKKNSRRPTKISYKSFKLALDARKKNSKRREQKNSLWLKQ